jgi:pimeloyl-ACP methyl ester carboxylesterase
MTGLVGCATSAGLPRERDIPELARLGQVYDHIPAKVTLVPTQRAGHEVKVAVHELGAGNRDKLAILLHGVLADADTWRYVAAELSTDYDVWLIDLPGCGASDKPKPRDLEADGYGPTALADRVMQAVAARLEARVSSVPKDVVMAGHSLGGTILLRAYGDPDLRNRHRPTLSRIDRLVLLSPCDLAVHAEISIFRTIATLKGWQVSIADALGILDRKCAVAMRDSLFTPNRATRELADSMKDVLARGPTRRAAQAMIRQAVPWRVKEHRPDWPAIEKLEPMLGLVDVPCLIVWGDRDEAFPVSMGHKLRDDVPGALLVKIEQSSHALPRERFDAVTEFIRAFNEGRPLPVIEAKPPKARTAAAP